MSGGFGGLKAIGSIFSGLSAYAAGKENAALLKQQGRTAFGNAVLEEDMQRREARESLGRTSAAIGESGTGYGGSSANVMDQAAIDAELDALNIRYKGQFAKYTYDYQSRIAKKQGKQALIGGALGAGADLLTGPSGGYGAA